MFLCLGRVRLRTDIFLKGNAGEGDSVTETLAVAVRPASERLIIFKSTRATFALVSCDGKMELEVDLYIEGCC